MGKIGIVLPENISAYQAGNIMENELNAMGYETFVEYGNNMEEQIQQIETMINLGCNLLICWAIEPEGGQYIFETAKEQGIAIIAFETLVQNTDAIRYYVSFDYYNAGILQGEYLRDKLDLDNVSDIRIALFTAEIDDWRWNKIFSGAFEILQPYLDDGKLIGEINYISDFSSEIAKSRMQELIDETGYDPYNLVYTAIYCSMDSYASGVIEALTEAGFDASNMPLITGFGGSEKALENIANGLQSMTIIVDFTEAAQRAAIVADKMLNGEDIDELTDEYLNNGNSDIPSGFANVTVFDSDSELNPVVLEKIEVVKQPNKLTYLRNERFDKTGMIVRAYYSNGATMEVTDSVNISPLIIKSKDTDVVISYEEDGVKKETSVNITVVEIGIDNSKINQTQLDYGCGAGKASINLFTQRLLFEHQDLSVGVNNYQIEVSHLYNSYFDEVVSLGNEEEHLNTNMGKGFKLNVQQYLFEKEGKYLYVDSMGYRHSFVELGDGVRYYDTDGLGLLLQVENGEKVVGDGSGNKMYFDAEGRLIKTISCYSEYLVKYFSYNDRGQLITIYDGRTPNNVISLSYDASTGLLKTMCSKQGGNIKRSIEYFYEKYNDIYYLVKITDESGDDVFAYNESGELVYAASKLDKTALTFRYKNYGITEVTEGIQDEDISKNTGLSASENIYISKEYIKDINSFSMKSDKSGVLVQNLKGLTKNNDKDVNVMYYFNKGGYTTAVLESPNGEENELRALEKLPGAPIVFPQSNLGEDKINKQSAYKVWDKLETNSLSEEVIDYRQKKYIQYKYYNVCFWLKLSDMLDSGKIIVNVQTSEGTDTGSVYVDNTAINAWQYVTVPVRIGGDTIKKISINSGDANMSNSLIADPRLSYSTKSGYFISSESGSRENIDSAEKISYKLVGADKETSISLNTECYMSGKDLHETILSIYNERPKKEKFTAKSNFILSLCNGTRKLWVENVEVHTKNNIFPLGIKYISPESGENSYGVACFEQETISPDDSSSNCGQMYLYPFVSLGGYAGEAIRQVTVCKKKNGDKTVETESCIYADFKGRTLQETDEYGVTITYYYDNFGSVQKKIVSHSDTTEKFVCDMEETSSSVCEKTEKSCVKAEFDETAGNIVRSSYSGKDEEGDTIAEYIYDEKNRIKEIQTSFRNLENPIENEVYGKNTLNYDERGRLYRISDSETHIEIGYNAFNEPNSYSLGKREMQKISNREEGSVSTILYNLNESYKTKIYTDKYGRTDKIENYKNSSMERSIYFARQELNESDGAAEVTEMFDGYEQKTYKYTYDEFNNPTGYRREKNNNDFFELKKIGPTKIEYTNLNSRIYQLVTEVKYDEEVNLFPRVSRTMCTFTEHYNTQQFWYYADYKYDSLGRIKEVMNSVEHHPQDSIYLKVENSYVNGTGLKEQIRMVSKNTYGETDDEYVLTYGYDKRGRIKTQKLDKIGADSYREEREYIYDGLDRVRYEKIGNETREYSYGPGGRVQAEYVGDKVKIYHYNVVTGCLEKITDDGEEREFNYDRLGNCTYYSGENYNSEVEWERGFLLKSINGAKYSYNTQGQRFRKELDGKTINYTYDGGRLIAEDDFAYFYDGEGIAGFAKSSTLNAVKFLYVKDGTGNVIAILNELGGTEVARYSYDAYGKCKVMNPDGTENKNENFIGNINPIRWKSQYYDKESELYYIDGRYYSPEIRQYLSAESLEETVEKGLVTDGLGSYQITVANPVNMVYNEYTIEPNTELSYDPEPLSEWEYFWNVAWSGFGRSSTDKALAIGLFAFVTALTAVVSIFEPGVWVLYGKAMASGAAFFLTGAAVSGLLSAIGGGDFLDGAWNYIRTNWAQALAIESLMYTVALGISCIAMARSASSQTFIPNTKIPNQLNPESYAKAIEGNPKFDTFRKRYWKAEALRAPELYGNNVEKMLKGRAPVINGEKLVLHHVAGRGIENIYNVVVLPQSQHIAFHKTYGYLKPEKWPNLWE